MSEIWGIPPLQTGGPKNTFSQLKGNFNGL